MNTETECPECGEPLDDDVDPHYMIVSNCCKVCYDDFHFGEEDEEWAERCQGAHGLPPHHPC